MEQWTIIDPLNESIEHADGVTIEGPEGVVATNVLEQHAAIIAAAPDLLAAMMAIQTIATAPINPAMDLKMIAKKAKAAIAKAKGGE